MMSMFQQHDRSWVLTGKIADPTTVIPLNVDGAVKMATGGRTQFANLAAAAASLAAVDSINLFDEQLLDSLLNVLAADSAAIVTRHEASIVRVRSASSPQGLTYIPAQLLYQALDEHAAVAAPWAEIPRTEGVPDAPIEHFCAHFWGEPGSGKEMVARAIHGESGRRDGPFVVVDCRCPDLLLDLTLWGAEPGTFTGSRPRGSAELANGGTLFVDAVDAMPLAVQGRFLRLLQEHELQRVGGTSAICLGRVPQLAHPYSVTAPPASRRNRAARTNHARRRYNAPIPAALR